jgi:hypothetical protein
MRQLSIGGCESVERHNRLSLTIIKNMDSKKRIYLVWFVFIVGAFLRFFNLGSPPLWIDEALFAGWAKGIPHQEFIPVILAKFLPDNEFFLRLPIAICGSLTVLLFYWMTGGGWKSFYGAACIAVFPIFVFWSRVARPYAFAGLFIVLGWRWWGFYIVAILTTPISLIGLNLFKLKEKKYRIIYPLLTVMAFVVYYIRPDVKIVGDFLDFNFLFNEKRMWYVPLLTLLLYCCSFIPDKYFVANTAEDHRGA